MPRVTVLVPVFNAAPFVRAALDSVLAQDFADFELLVLDDASTDGSAGVVAGVHDTRLRLVPGDRNMGVASVLNRGLDLATGEFVARMDADDLCRRDRLGRQVEFLDRHSAIAGGGSSVKLFGAITGTWRAPCSPSAVRAFMLFGNPVCHPSVMLRREWLQRRGLRYDPACTRSEDFDLWWRVLEAGDMDNHPDCLLALRMHANSVRARHGTDMREQTASIVGRSLTRLGIETTPAELAFHVAVGSGDRMESRSDICRAQAWLQGLVRANETRQAFDRAALLGVVGGVWERLCMNSAPLGTWVWRKCRESGWPCRGTGRDRTRFAASIAWHAVTGRFRRAGAV